MKDYNLVLKYIELERRNPIGCSVYAPLIVMLNEDKKIVKELLEDSECKYKSNLLSFLDYGLSAIYNKDARNEDLNMEVLINKIFYVLDTFNRLENKMQINGEEFRQLLKDSEVNYE